jgi:hypothetical protein
MVLAGFGLADLNAIDTATRDARELTSTERVASLRPRSVGRFVSLGSRVLPYAIAVTGLAIFILRWLTPSPNRRSFVAVTFALGAIVFLGLYDRWIHEEACGPQAEGGRSELEIKHRVRGIRYLQIVLVAGLLTAGNILIGIDWVTNSAVARGCSLVAGLLGVIGAGKALGSGFTGRRYQMVRE